MDAYRMLSSDHSLSSSSSSNGHTCHSLLSGLCPVVGCRTLPARSVDKRATNEQTGDVFEDISATEVIQLMFSMQPYEDECSEFTNRPGQAVQARAYLHDSLKHHEVERSLYYQQFLSTSTGSTRVPRMRSMNSDVNSVRVKKATDCDLCFSSRTPGYDTHVLRNRMGQVTCPVLSKYTCPHCGVTGDHTASHCKFMSLTNTNSPLKLASAKILKSTRNGAGGARH